MKSFHRWSGAVATALLATTLQPAQAAGTVHVRWIEPARFADAGRGTVDRERTLQALAEHLKSRAAWLPEGQTLTLEVTEVDLAGELEPWGWQALRVLRGRVDWPRLTLRYTLSTSGRAMKTGEAQLSDMSYSARRQDQPLGAEKHLLDQWLRAEFAAP